MLKSDESQLTPLLLPVLVPSVYGDVLPVG